MNRGHAARRNRLKRRIMRVPEKLPKNVFLIDDHAVLRASLAALINMRSDLQVCGEASDPTECVGALEAARPDIILLDLSVKHCNALPLLPALRARFPDMPVLIVTLHDDLFLAEIAMESGAAGYVTKVEAAATVISATRHVLAGGYFLAKRLADEAVRRLRQTRRDPVANLTARELQLLRVLAKWMRPDWLIGREGGEPEEWQTARTAMLRKLDLRNTLELLVFARLWTK